MLISIFQKIFCLILKNSLNNVIGEQEQQHYSAIYNIYNILAKIKMASFVDQCSMLSLLNFHPHYLTITFSIEYLIS